MPPSRLMFSLLLAAFAWAGLATGAMAQAGAPGSVFRDCADCPEMVIVPPGSFAMGEFGVRRESPVHNVTIARAFAVGRFDVTFDEFDACVADHGCPPAPRDFGWGRGRHPVVDVSWDDATAYAAWLSRGTGKHYRVPSEAEHEYYVRAGTKGWFWWGDDIHGNHANCDGCGSAWDNHQTAPVGSFAPNPFGIHDAIGNISRWVQDEWHANYDGAPADGSVWSPGDPERRVIRGGSWFNGSDRQHAAFRNGDSPSVHNGKIGFRIVRDL